MFSFFFVQQIGVPHVAPSRWCNLLMLVSFSTLAELPRTRRLDSFARFGRAPFGGKHCTRSESHRCYTLGLIPCQFSNAHLLGHNCSSDLRRNVDGVGFSGTAGGGICSVWGSYRSEE